MSPTRAGATDIVGLKLEQAGGREGAIFQYQIAGAFFAMPGKEKIETDVVGIGFPYSVPHGPTPPFSLVNSASLQIGPQRSRAPSGEAYP